MVIILISRKSLGRILSLQGVYVYKRSEFLDVVVSRLSSVGGVEIVMCCWEQFRFSAV